MKIKFHYPNIGCIFVLYKQIEIMKTLKNSIKQEKVELQTKIDNLIIGQTVKVVNYDEGFQGRFTLKAVTEKAILLNNIWIARKVIVNFCSQSNEIKFEPWYAQLRDTLK